MALITLQLTRRLLLYATPEPHRNHTGTTPEPHRNYIGTTPEPHRNHTGTTPEPHRNHTGTTPEPHRNHTDMNELERSHQSNRRLETEARSPCGRFQLPRRGLETGAVKAGAPERTVQQALVNITSATDLTQVHEEPTREENILDLVFTSNPTLNKSSKSLPGISDHSILVSDFNVKPQRTKE